MTSKVLYLFNSGLRPLYRENLQNIIALPSGCTRRFRYSLENQCPPDLEPSELTDQRGIIIFVDRFSEDSYTYHPLREAKILKAYKAGGRIFIDCILENYFCSNDPKRYTELLKASIPGVPELTDGNPENPNDGYYVALGEEIVEKSLMSGSDCWDGIIRALSMTNLLASFTFFKVELNNIKNDKPLETSKSDGRITLNPDSSYELRVHYFDPEKGIGNKSFKIKPNNIVAQHDETEIKIAAPEDIVQLSIETGNIYRKVLSSLNLEVSLGVEESFNIELPIKISALYFWGGIVLYSFFIFYLIVLKEYTSQPPEFWSIFLEGLKWAAGMRVLIKIGSFPQLPT